MQAVCVTSIESRDNAYRSKLVLVLRLSHLLNKGIGISF